MLYCVLSQPKREWAMPMADVVSVWENLKKVSVIEQKQL